jgi:UDP-N-acetyl-2-amino-2-deoxyglucuronate dehydrogenase
MLSFGLIGCGRIGVRHAALIPRYGRLEAVCDVDQARLEQLTGDAGVRKYREMSELLAAERLDVLVVCTPNGLHAAQSIAALRSGSHVLCEKPMAIRSTDARAMVDAAERSGRKLFVVKQNRYNPPVVELRRLLDKGLLGTILSVQVNGYWNRPAAYYGHGWHGTRELDGGMLYTQFSHFIDLLQWLFGMPDQVKAMLANANHRGIMPTEDQAIISMSFPGGMQAGLHFTVNAHGRNMEGSITVFGSKGTVKVGGPYLNEWVYQDVEGYEAPVIPRGNPANDYGAWSGSMSNHDKVYANLLDVLAGRATMDVTAEDGLRTVEIIESIYQSKD